MGPRQIAIASAALGLSACLVVLGRWHARDEAVPLGTVERARIAKLTSRVAGLGFRLRLLESAAGARRGREPGSPPLGVRGELPPRAALSGPALDVAVATVLEARAQRKTGELVSSLVDKWHVSVQQAESMMAACSSRAQRYPRLRASESKNPVRLLRQMDDFDRALAELDAATASTLRPILGARASSFTNDCDELEEQQEDTEWVD